MKDGKKIAMVGLVAILILISITSICSAEPLGDTSVKKVAPDTRKTNEPTPDPVPQDNKGELSTGADSQGGTQPLYNSDKSDGSQIDSTECNGFLKYDVNGDDCEDISDVVFLVSYLNADGKAPDPECRGDINSDNRIDEDDVYEIVEYMFGILPDTTPTILPGDANADGNIDIEDIEFLVSYMFNNGPAVDPVGGDVNKDGEIDIADLVLLCKLVFR